MEADELRLLPARQVLGFGAVGALTLCFASVAARLPTAVPFAIAVVALLLIAASVAPERPRVFRVASAAAAMWLVVPLVAPPAGSGAITVIALAAAAASAWSADFLYHEWRPARPSAAVADQQAAEAAARAEIVDLDPAVNDLTGKSA